MSPPAAARPDLAEDTETDVDHLCRILESVDPAELEAELRRYAEGADAQPLALPDAAVPANTPAHFVQILEGAHGQLPEAARAGMIAFFKKVIADADAQIPQIPPGTKLVQCNISNPKPGSSFPHLVVFNGALSAEDEACQWEQYKSRMTIIKVRLLDAQGAPPPRSYPMWAVRLVFAQSCIEPASCPVSVAGQPVLGSTLQPGGPVLRLTLLNATTGQPLSDAHNPRQGEGLFLGTGRKQFETTVRLTKSTHTFEFKVMLLSSDIGGALVKIKVAPPNAEDGHPLCVITRDFLSRARSNVHEKNCADQFRSLSSGDGDEGAVFRSAGDDDDDGGMVFRSALNEDEDGDEEDEVVDEVDEVEDEMEDEEDEEAEAPTSSNQARTLDQLQRLLSGLESKQPMPSGPALLEALCMCWIGG